MTTMSELRESEERDAAWQAALDHEHHLRRAAEREYDRLQRRLVDLEHEVTELRRQFNEGNVPRPLIPNAGRAVTSYMELAARYAPQVVGLLAGSQCSKCDAGEIPAKVGLKWSHMPDYSQCSADGLLRLLERRANAYRNLEIR